MGHASGSATGVTVVLCPDGAVVGADIRGGATGTRGLDPCLPGHLVDRVQGICLAGGSAFGLAAAGGVMRSVDPPALFDHRLAVEDGGPTAGLARVPDGLSRRPLAVCAGLFAVALGLAWRRYLLGQRSPFSLGTCQRPRSFGSRGSL